MDTRHLALATLRPIVHRDSLDDAFLLHLLEEAHREAMAAMAWERAVAPARRPAAVPSRVDFSVD